MTWAYSDGALPTPSEYSGVREPDRPSAHPAATSHASHGAHVLGFVWSPRARLRPRPPGHRRGGFPPRCGILRSAPATPHDSVHVRSHRRVGQEVQPARRDRAAVTHRLAPGGRWARNIPEIPNRRARRATRRVRSTTRRGRPQDPCRLPHTPARDTHDTPPKEAPSSSAVG